MRGSPYLQAIFMVVVVALAGVPVWRLTRPATAGASVPASAATSAADRANAKPAPLEVEAVFAPAAADFQIKNLDQTLLSGRGPQARFTTRWAASVPAEGVDLVVQAHWPELTAGDATHGVPVGAGPAAARITVRFPDGRQVEKSFWAEADGSLAEVFTLPGSALPAAP